MDTQPEDFLTDFLRSPEAYRKMKEMTPWFFYRETGKATVAPNEVHQMLEWGVNTLLKRQVDRFSTGVSIETIIAHLMNGGGVVLSGEFRLKKRNLHHIVSLAGFVTDGNEDVTQFIIDDPYDPNGGQIELTGGTFNTPGSEVTVWSDLLKAQVINGTIPDDAEGVSDQQRAIFNSPWFNAMYVVGLQRKDSSSFFTSGDKLIIPLDVYPYTEADVYQFTTSSRTITDADERELFDKVNVFPNPLYGFNILTGYDGTAPDEPFITFTNLPTDITVKVYSLSGQLLRTLSTEDKSSPDSPFLRWDLQNENGLRVASGLYIAIISSKKFGDKILKFTIIMPQKQIPRF